MLLSPELWTLGAVLPLSPNVGGFRETGYLALDPARISFHLEQNRSGPVFLKVGPDDVARLVGLDGESASRLDRAQLRYLDDGGSLSPCPQTSENLRGCVQTEGKYPKLVNLVFEGKPEVLSAAWMNWYMKVRILQV